ncbi:MAG TPA: hypothetical protein VFE97_16190 [Methylomirabilota bacterium]|nr:hypothetical protein [Methylomirabilota bacterium]
MVSLTTGAKREKRKFCLDTIDRIACRRHLEERFTVERMVDDYESIYRSLTAVGEAA